MAFFLVIRYSAAVSGSVKLVPMADCKIIWGFVLFLPFSSLLLCFIYMLGSLLRFLWFLYHSVVYAFVGFFSFCNYLVSVWRANFLWRDSGVIFATANKARIWGEGGKYYVKKRYDPV